MTTNTDLPSFLQYDPPLISPIPTPLRLQALYASTSSQRQSNPTGYAANVTWWENVLEEILRSGWVGQDRLVLRVDDVLLSKLEWGSNRPKGIGGVVERLSTTHPPLLHPLSTFLSSSTPLHAQPSLTSRLVARPLWWAVSQLNPFGSNPDAVVKEETLWSRYGKGKEYVHMPLLEQSAALFTKYLNQNPPTAYSASLYSLSTFTNTFAEICFPSVGTKLPKGAKGEHRLSKRDVEILLKWLSRECGVVITDGEVVKVLNPGESASEQAHAINEAERGTVTILSTLEKLDKQVEDIQAQIERSQSKAKHHLSLSQRNIALSHLRSKNQLEELLERRIGAAEQLRGVLRGIDQAKGDVEIMAAYRTSTSTLRTLLSHPSLSLEHIEATTDELAEVMANQQEVDEAVRIGGEIATGSSAVVVDEGELADELEELVREEKEKLAREQKEKEEKKEREQERSRKEAEVRREKDVEAKLDGTTAKADQGDLVRATRRLSLDPAPGSAPIQDRQTRGTESAITSGAQATSSASNEELAQRQWEERYEVAQQRKREEGERAQVERMRRDERVVENERKKVEAE